MKFIVTGTGRSGTGYISALFQAAGLRCGHESWFRSLPGLWGEGEFKAFAKKVPLYVRLRESIRRRVQRLDGDASWMAVPRLPDFQGLVFLQLRHPLPVISSFGATQFFSRTDRNISQRSFATTFFEATGDDTIDAMRWWVLWNRKAEDYADLVYPLEGLDQALFTTILEMLNVSDASRRAEVALKTVPTTINSAKKRGLVAVPLKHEQLPKGVEKRRLQKAAFRWGYDLATGF